MLLDVFYIGIWWYISVTFDPPKRALCAFIGDQGWLRPSALRPGISDHPVSMHESTFDD